MTSNNSSLFDKTLYVKVLAVILALAVAGLFASFLYFSSITVTDTVGTCISAAIVAYMVHLYILIEEMNSDLRLNFLFS